MENPYNSIIPRPAPATAIQYIETHRPDFIPARCILHGYVDCATCSSACPTCGKFLADGHWHVTHSISLPATQPAGPAEPVKLRRPRTKNRAKYGKPKNTAKAVESSKTVEAFLAENAEANFEASPSLDSPEEAEFWKHIIRVCDKSAYRHLFKKGNESRPVWEDRRGDASGTALLALMEPDTRAALESKTGDEQLKFAQTVAKRRVINTGIKASERREFTVSQIKRVDNSDYDPSHSDLYQQDSVLDSLSSRQAVPSEFGNVWVVEDNQSKQLQSSAFYNPAASAPKLVSEEALRELFSEALANLGAKERMCFFLYANYGSWAIPGGRTYNDVAGCLSSQWSHTVSVPQAKRLFKKAQTGLMNFLVERLPSAYLRQQGIFVETPEALHKS
jgi:hypothetical protein